MRRQNLNSYAKRAVVPMFVLFTAVASFGAVLLEDGFTDAGYSHGKWLASEGLTATVSGGSCQLNNTSGGVGGYLHTFSGTKPSTFTITYTLKSQTGSANQSGALFCKQANTYNGYFLTVEEDELIVYKMTQTGNSIGWDPLYWKESIDINASNNEITVSKSGSRIVLFANGEYVGEFTDTTYNSGDFALFLSGNVTAVFGPVRITDEFTNGEARTSFSDNFDNGPSRHWKYLSNGEPEIGVTGGMLKIKTAANVSSWMYVEMGFSGGHTARVDVRHESGGKTINDMYGILLLGDPPAGGGSIPMAYFAISGDRKYSLWTSSQSPRPDPVQDMAIKGSAGITGAIYTDTLEVSRKSGASTYEFAVNGQTLAADFSVDFTVTGVGIFSFSSTAMTVVFDNFEAKKDGTTSINFGKNPQTVRGGKNAAAKNANTVFYDLRGRKRFAANPQAVGRVPLRASGVYVNQDGRKVLTDRNKRTR